MTRKKRNDNFLKYIGVGTLFVMIFIGYQLYLRNSSPKNELDCLKLGSNERTALCLQMLKKPEPIKDFPLNYLSIEDVKAEKTPYCIEVSGSIKNNHASLIANNIALRVNFSKQQYGEQFHYEVFGPLQTTGEQIQPNSKKTFTKCLNNQTYSAVKDVNKWYFSILPYSAKVLEN